MAKVNSIYPAKIHSVTETFLECPWCNVEEGFAVTNFKPQPGRDGRFGPWYCKVCGHSIVGKCVDDVFFVDKCMEQRIDMATLIKLNRKQVGELYLIVKDSRYQGDPAFNREEHELADREYYVEDHVCPSTLFSQTIEVLTETDGTIDRDEHGLFQYIASINYNPVLTATSTMIDDLWSLRDKPTEKK